MSDERQQQELEEERMQRELEALRRVDRAGLHGEARFLATELGLSTQFKQESSNAKSA